MLLVCLPNAWWNASLTVRVFCWVCLLSVWSCVLTGGAKTVLAPSVCSCVLTGGAKTVLAPSICSCVLTGGAKTVLAP